uniref:Uncharacterized protein LOC111102007 n=1 Tax=Crassostrea virginica TaxID=6565 RepID=A0A8B8AK18_CRAVI|nr:uncharacterized protein LOC111102007 [Crassostrea virginica]
MRESFVFLQGDANLTRVHHHVTGVLAHGQKKAYAFTWTDKFHPDTNITINCLLHVLEDVAEDKALPPVLYLQADNSAKDNKNFILIGFLANLVQRKVFHKIKLSFLMVGHTHEDVDQMFSRISVHLTGKPIPTLPVLQSLMRDAYHPTPMVQHLDGLWNYRKLGMASGVTLHGHSGPHVFRFKEVEGAVQLGYKQWPYQSAPYKVIDVTQLAAAFEVDPEPVMTLNEKGRTSLEAMESDLRKWQEGGKLTGSDIAWWETHIDGERCMAAPSAPLASSFLHFAESENRDEVAYPELDALSAHINTLSNESNVRVSKKRR